jgi:hypothetical protein
MKLFKTLAVVGLVGVGLASAYADSPNPKLPDKEELIQYSESMDKLLQSLECSFTKRIKLLPAWNELHEGEHSFRNKDGYNDIEEVLYRRVDPKWYVRQTVVTNDDEKHCQFGKHYDGTMFWETHDYQNPVGIFINNQLPNVPIFIDRILSRFPSDSDGYGRVYKSEIPFDKAPTLKEVLTNPENEIRIVPIKVNEFKVMAIHPNPKHPFAGMNLLKEFYFNTSHQNIRLVEYHTTAMYINHGKEHIFSPYMKISFSDFVGVSDSNMEVPRNIKTILYEEDTRRVTKRILNSDFLIKLDKAGWNVPIQEEAISISSFNKNFSFDIGDVEFNYKTGTGYWDHRDKKKHCVGETNTPSKTL